MSEPVLFVHGAAGDARIWQPVIATLPAGFAGHAVTLRYFGDAPWPDDGSQFGTALHAEDIERAARAIGEKVHLVCWSYGVHPGLAALLAAPELFASALLYEAALPHYITRSDERRVYLASYQGVFGPVAEALRSGGPESSVRALFGPDHASLPPERLAIYLSNARMMPLLMGGGLPPMKITPKELAEIVTPCCAAMGSLTPDCFAIPTRALAEAVPDARLREVLERNHFMPETHPAEFAALVADWVAEVGRR